MTAIEEMKKALEFFDLVKAAPENERIAVGQDHWDWLESAARRVVGEEAENDDIVTECPMCGERFVACADGSVDGFIGA